jgi:hypothetical protein
MDVVVVKGPGFITCPDGRLSDRFGWLFLLGLPLKVVCMCTNKGEQQKEASHGTCYHFISRTY